MPTIEVVLQLKLSAFTCRTDEAIVSYRLEAMRLGRALMEQVIDLEHVVEWPAAAVTAAAGCLASGCGRGVRGWSVASGGGSGGWQWSS